jgi:hypothetical protein
LHFSIFEDEPYEAIGFSVPAIIFSFLGGDEYVSTSFAQLCGFFDLRCNAASSDLHRVSVIAICDGVFDTPIT